MTQDTIKAAIREFLNNCLSKASDAELRLEVIRGVALYDLTLDEQFTSLTSFEATTQALTTLPNFGERYGNDSRNRILLQFLYQYFERVDNLQFHEAAFESLWIDFLAELAEAHWIYCGVANLRHFRLEDDAPTATQIELGDGISIRGRSPADLKSLGFDDLIWERIEEDWRIPFGHSSYVLVSEHRAPKSPDNLIRMDSFTVSNKALRALQALRLCGAGSISIGAMWMIRAGRFNVGLGGVSQSGFSIPTMGTDYIWTKDIGCAQSVVYQELAQLEKDGYGKAPGNLEVALRVFMSSYDRWPSRSDTQLLDAITSLEALFGLTTELSFRLAYRVASLLASSDADRGEMLKLMKGFYDTRSKIVHGGQLKAAQQSYLEKVEELRSFVRRLLKSFVSFAVKPPNGYRKEHLGEELDGRLVNAAEREKIRAALGLT